MGQTVHAPWQCRNRFSFLKKGHGALLPLGWNTLYRPLIVSGMIFAIGLTIGRPIVKLLKCGRPKANLFGKIKAYCEIVLIAVLVIGRLAPLDAVRIVANVILAIATVGGGISLGGQCTTAYNILKDKSRKA